MIKKRHIINEWIFSKTEIFRNKCQSWIRFVYLCKKRELKNAAGVDTSGFAIKKADLDNLKSDVDKLDIDKLKSLLTNFSNFKSKVDKLDVDTLVPVPVDLSKISDVVKNDIVKKSWI